MNIATKLLLLIVLGCGGIILQIFLSRRESKWPGLILPVIPFLYSLIMVLNLAAFDNMDFWQIAGKVLAVFLLANFPTAVLLGIYFACREKWRKKKQFDKMNAMDLE